MNGDVEKYSIDLYLDFFKIDNICISLCNSRVGMSTAKYSKVTILNAP